MKPSPDDFLPLKPVPFQVLLSLASGEQHGYGIVQDIAKRRAFPKRLDPGNLYKSLRALLDDALIVESERRPAADLDDERRRYYRLTPLGRQVAEAEAARLERVARQARAALRPARGRQA
jgi:DNA-binding PadR family transcriptional regulator